MSTASRGVGVADYMSLYGPPAPVFSPLFSTVALLSEASIRDIIREEIRAALDEDAARRAVLVDYDRLTAEWRRKHGGAL